MKKLWVALALVWFGSYAADRLGYMPLAFTVDARAHAPSVARSAKVQEVVDGDTVRSTVGFASQKETIRLIGLDTPESYSWGFTGATHKLKSLVSGSASLAVKVCPEQTHDRYQRVLGSLWAGDVDLQLEILRSGWARVLTIPPCGLDGRTQYTQAMWEAVDRKKGYWKRADSKTICTLNDFLRKPEHKKAIQNGNSREFYRVDGVVQQIKMRSSTLALHIAETVDGPICAKIVVLKNALQKQWDGQDLGWLDEFQNFKPRISVGNRIEWIAKPKVKHRWLESIVGAPEEIRILAQ